MPASASMSIAASWLLLGLTKSVQLARQMVVFSCRSAKQVVGEKHPQTNSVFSLSSLNRGILTRSSSSWSSANGSGIEGREALWG